jgi:hypothetical protein
MGGLIDTPQPVSGLDSGVAAVTTGNSSACALTTTGGVKCWGDNGSGEVGDGTSTSRDVPVDVVGLGSGVAAISSGEFDSCALTIRGGILCWGAPIFGQLGNGMTTGDVLTPGEVIGFENPRTLSVTKAGGGGGTVTSNPTGIDCGATCSHDYAFGTSVTLTANPAPGSVFAGWTGGGCSGTATCTITMNADTTITATFSVIQTVGSGSPPPGGSSGSGSAGGSSSSGTGSGTHCIVPKLRGLKLAKAKAKLRKAHCRLGRVRRRFSTKHNKGRVIRQRVRAGKQLPAGARVGITLGKGPRTT